MRYLLIVPLIVLVTVNTLAQTPTICTEYGGKLVPILQSKTRKFKIKAIVGVSSKTAREADYVEFRTMEKIYAAGKPPILLFDEDTPIYGLVTRRKSRHFPLTRGKLELELEPLIGTARTFRLLFPVMDRFRKTTGPSREMIHVNQRTIQANRETTASPVEQMLKWESSSQLSLPPPVVL